MDNEKVKEVIHLLLGVMTNSQPDSDSEYEDAKFMQNCMSNIRFYTESALAILKEHEQ